MEVEGAAMGLKRTESPKKRGKPILKKCSSIAVSQMGTIRRPECRFQESKGVAIVECGRNRHFGRQSEATAVALILHQHKLQYCKFKSATGMLLLISI